MEIFFLKRLVVGKLSQFSGMLNDAFMHREGLTLPLPNSRLRENHLPLPNSHLCEIHMCTIY